MSSNWLEVVIGGVFAIVFSGFGLLVLLVYVRARALLAASQNWPSVQGRIDESRVTSLTSTSQGHTTTRYAPEVKYTYSVMGTPYQGSHIGFGLTISGLHPNAEKVVKRFPAGETRPVYYNPQNPAQAVLERRMENNAKALIMPIVCLVIGIGAGVITAGMLYRFK